jgi:CRP-like cAMP-binding protein
LSRRSGSGAAVASSSAPALLYALERDDFLDALASHPPLAAAAGRIAAVRLQS